MPLSKKPATELLAPAGDMSRLKYAFAYGADAVYLGLPEFSLRAKTGFDFASLKDGIAYAHQLKKKVFVTVNIFAHEDQITILPKFLKQLKDCRPDAVIVSDPGVLRLVRKILPRVPLHLSTQANTLNSEAVKFWQENGVRRIILGREASLSDIKKIHKLAPKMELEVFVHGAMCMSYSGRCYLSAELSKRSANLGACTQPCRWQYNLYAEEVTRSGKLLPLSEDGQGMYLFNSKDLCLIDYLAELQQAGVTSFKIEGRTKSLYYVSNVVKAYRLALDNPKGKKILAEAKKELQKIDSRGYTTGFITPEADIEKQNFETSKAQSDWRVVGQVVGQQDGLVEMVVHNTLKAGESIELLTPDNCYKLKIKKLLNHKGEQIIEAHGGGGKNFFLPIAKTAKVANGFLRKKLV